MEKVASLLLFDILQTRLSKSEAQAETVIMEKNLRSVQNLEAI